MSSPRLEIPQELVNKIVDEFAADATTLAHLSLVSTSFNARCREYLFSAVEFCGERPDRKHFRDFASILDNNPDVVSNIRELRLWDGNHTYGARMPWMVNDTTFHQTLRTLADNRQLTNFMWGADYHWSSLPKGLRQALLQIFSAPNLSLVRLWGLAAVPQACFASLNNLTELALTEVNIQRGNNLSAVGAPHLRMLYIADMDSGSCQNLLDAFLPHEGVFPSLVDLDINIGPKSQNDMVALKEFVRAGSQTLTGFSWVNECTSFTYHPNFNDVSLPSLCELDYQATLYDDASKPFDGLFSVFRSAGSDSPVRSLILTLRYKHFTIAHDSVVFDEGWNSFVSMVTSTRLEKLILCLMVDDPRTLDERNTRISMCDVALADREAALTSLVERRTMPIKSKLMCEAFKIDCQIAHWMYDTE